MCTKNLRTDFLIGADTGGVWSWIGYAATIGGSYSTLNGTNPGVLIGDNPAVDFNNFIVGFYKFRYARPSSITCGFPVEFIIPVQQQPNAGINGTVTDCTGSYNIIDLFSKLGGSPQQGGIWSIISGSPPASSYDLSAGIFVIDENVTTGTYVFKYTINEPTPPAGYTNNCSDCAASESTVTITINQSANAGTALNKSNCN